MALYSSCITGAIGEEEYLAGLREAGLTDVAVRDRLTYDADQLEEIASSAAERDCGCGQAASKSITVQVGRSLAGKVWSAKVYARKPA